MKRYLKSRFIFYSFAAILTSLFVSCNSYNNKMNKLLSEKKMIEIKIDTINEQDQRFRLMTGYNEIDDSLSVETKYPHQELVDSIRYLKEMKAFLEDNLHNVNYSIDSLEKLK